MIIGYIWDALKISKFFRDNDLEKVVVDDTDPEWFYLYLPFHLYNKVYIDNFYMKHYDNFLYFGADSHVGNDTTYPHTIPVPDHLEAWSIM